jgi:hypothetical protein
MRYFALSPIASARPCVEKGKFRPERSEVAIKRVMAVDTDTIDTVSSDGETVIMQSGRTYESDDPATSSSWTPGSEVVITNSDKIINTDEGGESVEGTEQ